jgi:prevent-host-death family protein
MLTLGQLANGGKLMPQINIHEAKTRLSQLVAMAESGTEIVIARAGKPVAKLIPFSGSRRPRRLGLLAGKIKFKRGWDAPLTDRELADWYGAPLDPRRR